jgi:D-serine deaminase-like pyridoxal phosphate-dependent protein
MESIYDLDTPTLLVDLDQLERNIADMAELARSHGKSLRPHTKTHKTPDIARMQIAAGAKGLTVAKLGEAETLANAGFEDLFVANQIIGPLKVGRLLGLMERVQVKVGVDSMESAEPLGIAGVTRGVRVPVMIEVDTGLGRAGVRTVEEAVTLARKLDDHAGIWMVGIFTHEGQLYTGSNEPDLVGARRVAEQMRRTASEIRAAAVPCDLVSVGSTPGAPLLAPEEGIDELRPGVYVFNDRTQVVNGGDRSRWALTVLVTVTSVRPNGVIITDGGSKSMAGDCPYADKTYGEIMGHPEIVFKSVSEEHGHLECTGTPTVKVGDKLRIVPNHACTCVNMHDTLTLHRGDRVEAVLPIECRGKIT